MRGTCGHSVIGCTRPADICAGSVEPTPSRLVLPAFAKVNWILDIVDRRPDGYHDLETVASTVTLADEVVLEVRAERSGIRLTCSDPSLPADETNLAYRAASLLARRAGAAAGVDIHLGKRIPMGGGLGGGSADAAAVLNGLNRLWGLGWSSARLVPLAAAVGSDVPLLMSAGTAVARGRGEFVERMPFAWGGWLVLAMPGMRTATRDVYAAVSAEDLRAMSDAAEVFTDADCAAHWSAGDLLMRCRNGLEAPAFRRFPALGELHRALCRRFDRPWRLCGSGSSFFTAWDTADEAEACARLVRDQWGFRAEIARVERGDAGE